MAGWLGIGGTVPVPVGQGGRPAGRAGAAFRLPAAAGPAGPSRSAPLAAAAPIGLFAVQDAGDAPERNRRGAARARSLLGELSALQAGLLGGPADPAGLERIAALAEGESPPDPALAEALAGIALRARVELAKRGIMVAQA